MANRIQPHPNPPYLKSDGTLNSLGQLKLYASGTATPKVAYKDASGTSYGSTIDLDSAGLPEDGPIYWDTTALYKVEVYTRVDDTPTYALDYTVDSFGELASDASGVVSTDTTITVDGIGAGANEYATMAEGLDAARAIIPSGDAFITISVKDGTYDEGQLDVSHPNGARIKIVGESTAGTILLNSEVTSSPTIEVGAGISLASIETCTIKRTNSTSTAAVLHVKLGGVIHDLSCTIDGGTDTYYGLHVDTGARVTSVSGVVSNDAYHTAILCANGGLLNAYGLTTQITDLNAGTGYCIRASGAGSVINMTVSTVANTQTGYQLLESGLYADSLGQIKTGLNVSVVKAEYGMKVATGGQIHVLDNSPTFTSINTADYNVTVNTLSTTTGTLIII